MTLDAFTYHATLDQMSYHLRVHRQDTMAHATLAMRWHTHTLLAVYDRGEFTLHLPTHLLKHTSDALAIIGPPATDWRQVLATTQGRVGLLAQRWYDLHDFTIASVQRACARLALPGADLCVKETRKIWGQVFASRSKEKR